MDRKKYISNLITSLIIDRPLYGMLLRRCRIVYEDEPFYAMVNERELVIGQKFFDYSIPEQKFVLMHEALHLLSKHPERCRKLIQRFGAVAHPIANYVADGKINHALILDGFGAPREAVTVRDVAEQFQLNEDYVLKESVEQIVIEIMRKIPEDVLNAMNIAIDVIIEEGENSSSSNDEGDGKDQGDQESKSCEGCGSGKSEDSTREVLNEGDRRLQEAKDGEELERVKEDILRETEVAAKMAGISAGEISRLIEEVAKPKVNWRRVLRVSMEKGLGNDVRKTWSRESRKHKDLPAKQMFGIRKMIALVDTSGSITKVDLEQIFGELHAIAKLRTQVIVIPWDTKVYDIITMKSPRDIKKVTKHLKGGGGTKITPAIEKAKELTRNGELIVVFSDFHLNESDQKLDRLLRNFKRSNVLLVSVNGRIPKVNAKVIKIETV